MAKMFEKPQMVAALSVIFAVASWLNWTAVPVVPDHDVDDDDPVEIASSPTLPPGPYDDNGNGMPDLQRPNPHGGDSDDDDRTDDEDVALVAGRAVYSRTTVSA